MQALKSQLLTMGGLVENRIHRAVDSLIHRKEAEAQNVIESDVDGPNALPRQLDSEQPNLKRFSATRRVARTIYMGSAPTVGQTNKGIDDRSIKLGCVQPGESPATFVTYSLTWRVSLRPKPSVPSAWRPPGTQGSIMCGSCFM